MALVYRIGADDGGQGPAQPLKSCGEHVLERGAGGVHSFLGRGPCRRGASRAIVRTSFVGRTSAHVSIAAQSHLGAVVTSATYVARLILKLYLFCRGRRLWGCF